MLQLWEMGERRKFYCVAAEGNRIKVEIYGVAAATNLFKEFSSGAGSYRKRTLVTRPDDDHRSLGASLHILFFILKENGSSAKENKSKNKQFIYVQEFI